MGLNSWNPALDAMEQTVDAYIEYTSRLNVDATEIPPAESSEADLIPSERGLVLIDSKLAKLVSIEEKLKASRIHLQSLRNASVTLAPINRLPVDLLTMVILAGYEDTRFEDEKYRRQEFEIFRARHGSSEPEDLDAQHFPTTFSHVCRRWRAVALSTATVWSYLLFGPGYSCENLAAWIQRTKECDLTLELVTVDKNDTVDFRRALGIIGPNVLRATSLILVMHTKGLLLKGLKHFSAYGRPPPLKQLTLFAPGSSKTLRSEDFGEANWEVLMDMTRGLEHVHFRGVYFPLGGPAYRGLKTLHLEALKEPIIPGDLPRDEALLTIFQGSPELESLTLAGVEPSYYDSGISGQPSPVVLGKLKTLSLFKMSLMFTCFVLSVLSTPALEKLSLGNVALDSILCDVPDSERSDAYLGFFKNLRPASLKFFSLRDAEMCNMDPLLSQMLDCTPNLESLCLGDEASVGTVVLNAMLRQEYLVPKLERLWLHDCRFSAQLLKDVVLQRTGSDSLWPIRHLVVENCRLEDVGVGILPILEAKVEKLGWEGNETQGSITVQSNHLLY